MKHMKKLLSLLLVLCLVLSLSCTAFAAGAEKPLDGKTVILHSNRLCQRQQGRGGGDHDERDRL